MYASVHRVRRHTAQRVRRPVQYGDPLLGEPLGHGFDPTAAQIEQVRRAAMHEVVEQIVEAEEEAERIDDADPIGLAEIRADRVVDQLLGQRAPLGDNPFRGSGRARRKPDNYRCVVIDDLRIKQRAARRPLYRNDHAQFTIKRTRQLVILGRHESRDRRREPNDLGDTGRRRCRVHKDEWPASSSRRYRRRHRILIVVGDHDHRFLTRSDPVGKLPAQPTRPGVELAPRQRLRRRACAQRSRRREHSPNTAPQPQTVPVPDRNQQG